MKLTLDKVNAMYDAAKAQPGGKPDYVLHKPMCPCRLCVIFRHGPRVSDVFRAWHETFSFGGRVHSVVNVDDSRLSRNDLCVREQLIGEAWEREAKVNAVLTAVHAVLRRGFWKEPGREAFVCNGHEEIGALARAWGDLRHEDR